MSCLTSLVTSTMALARRDAEDHFPSQQPRDILYPALAFAVETRSPRQGAGTRLCLLITSVIR